MIRNKHFTLLGITLGIIAATGVLTIALIGVGTTQKRSTTGRMVRTLKGESYQMQMANDLADDIRSKPEMAQLQSWCLSAMASFRENKLKSTNRSGLYWTHEAVTLDPGEMPDFIRNTWARTNFGMVWPRMEIVCATNRSPEYVVLEWLGYGVAVGAKDYQLTFSPRGTNEIAPGIYTYYLLKE